VYRSFEEFEREELRRAPGGLSGSIDELLDGMFAEELDFDFGSGGRRRRDEDESDE
jgi:hypothetical protein